MSDTNLEPCPWCGGEEIGWSGINREFSGPSHRRCEKCGTCLPIAAWNEVAGLRARAEKAGARVAELEADLQAAAETDDERVEAIETEAALRRQAEARVAELEAERDRLLVKAWQAGYRAGHHDTVEGRFSFAAVEEDEGALEFVAELNAEEAPDA